MHCQPIKLPGGQSAIVCGPTPRPKTCSVCKRQTREPKLCDFPIRPGKTCDAVMCPACASHKEPDTDHCPLHAAASEGRLKL